MAKIIEFIYTQERVGSGNEGDPIRLIPQLWTKEGQLVAEYDQVTGKTFFSYN